MGHNDMHPQYREVHINGYLRGYGRHSKPTICLLFCIFSFALRGYCRSFFRSTVADSRGEGKQQKQLLVAVKTFIQ